MSKRPSTEACPAAKRVKENADAMGCIIMAVKRSNDNLAKEMADVKEKNRYLSEQVERLDAYSFELENRMSTMETLITSMIAGGNHHIVDAYIHGMREHNNYDMTDLDRILQWINYVVSDAFVRNTKTQIHLTDIV